METIKGDGALHAKMAESSRLIEEIRQGDLMYRSVHLCNCELRWYQELAIQLNSEADNRSSVTVLPTGAGKTLVGVGLYVSDCHTKTAPQRRRDTNAAHVLFAQ